MLKPMFKSMLKSVLKISGITLLVIIALYGFARLLDKSIGGIYDAARAPYLQMASSDSVTIHWQTKKQNIGVVRIGRGIHQVDKVFSEDVADDEHSIRLTGLQPNTKYYYSVGTREFSIYEGSDYWFKTSPSSNDSRSAIRFWVTGDQGQAGKIQSDVRDAMLSWTKKNSVNAEKSKSLDFWLTTGDNAYRSGTNQQFQDNFFIPYATILKHTPVWPAYGNHDARRWVFHNIFSFPTKGEAGGVASATEKYYSFDYGALHVVMLDSQTSRIQKNSKMLRWLQKDLAATKQKWLVAVFHHPPFTKGSHNSDNPADSLNRMQNVRKHVLPILEQAGVDVVLSGHSHMYERSWFMNCHYDTSDTFTKNLIQDRKPIDDGLVNSKELQNGKVYRKAKTGLSALAGTIYITIGSSARVDVGELNHPAMPVSLHKTGSLVFDIIDNKLTANFITETEQVADSFSIVKGDNDAPVALKQCQ